MSTYQLPPPGTAMSQADLFAYQQSQGKYPNATPGNPLGFNPSTVQGSHVKAKGQSPKLYVSPAGVKAGVTPNPQWLIDAVEADRMAYGMVLDQQSPNYGYQNGGGVTPTAAQAAAAGFLGNLGSRTGGGGNGGGGGRLSAGEMAARYGVGDGFRENAWFLDQHQPGYVPPVGGDQPVSKHDGGSQSSDDPRRRRRRQRDLAEQAVERRRSYSEGQQGGLLQMLLGRIPNGLTGNIGSRYASR